VLLWMQETYWAQRKHTDKTNQISVSIKKID